MNFSIEIIDWLKSEVPKLLHGELHIIIKIHDGRIALIEKQKTERSKPNNMTVQQCENPSNAAQGGA